MTDERCPTCGYVRKDSPPYPDSDLAPEVVTWKTLTPEEARKRRVPRAVIDLITQELDRGLNCREISRRLRVNEDRVSRIASRHGIYNPTPTGRPRIRHLGQSFDLEDTNEQ